MTTSRNTVSGHVLFVWCMMAGLMFFFAPQNLGNKCQLAFAGAFRRPLNLCRKLALSIRTEPVSSPGLNLDRYNLLRNELANTKERLAQEREKVEKLSGLRDRSVWKGAEFVLADVITSSVSGSHAGLYINRGANDGLAVGQFILADHSIIGAISEIDSRTARVKLITDPTSKIAVKVAGASSEPATGGIMQGDGSGAARILLLPTTHKVEKGNMVYAEKKPGLLDTPMITATVTNCRRDAENPLIWDITVEPACDLQNLRQVAVVVMNPQQ
jgi:rod shape-determining protein MreC